jgi:hypothetical protein
MSHTVKNQAWQKSSDEETKPPEPEVTEKMEGEEPKTSLETGIGVPCWTFKLEGKLLHVWDFFKQRLKMSDLYCG